MKLELSGAHRFAGTPAVLILLLATAALGWGQTPAPGPVACSKNVSFAVAEGAAGAGHPQVRREMDRQEIASARLQGPLFLSDTVLDDE